MKKIIALIITASFILLSACSDYEDTVTPSPTVDANNPAVRFVFNHEQLEVDPEEGTTIYVKVARNKSESAAEYPIVVITNTDNSYIIPDKVSFAAGEETTDIEITMSTTAKTAVPIPLNIAIPEEYSNPYKSGYPIYYCTTTIVGWENLGKAQFFDSFTLVSVAEVDLLYSAAVDQYRFTNPYSKELLTEAGLEDWIGGPTSDLISFKITEDKQITWDFWYLGVNYQATAGQPIKAYFPSVLDPGATKDDMESMVDPENEKLLIFYPNFYIDDVGGFGNAYCYLSMPGGPDLNELLDL